MGAKYPAVAIDMGTTTSLVGYLANHTPCILPNDRGNLATPCMVAFKDSQTAWVGELARNLLLSSHRENVVVYPKKYLGTETLFKIQGREYSPAEIMLIILRKLKNLAATYLKVPERALKKAILTVPAYFTDTQKTAVLNSGKLAGFEQIRLVSEPVAAAVAYGYKDALTEERLMVFDLGGGSLDVTLLETSDGCFYVKGFESAPVGGASFDKALADFLGGKFEEMCGVNFTDDPILYRNLMEVTEKTKADLSFVDETEVLFPYMLIGNNTKKNYLNVRINRYQFKRITEPLFDRMRETVLKAFKKSSVVPGWVTRVIISGGASRLPGIKQMLNSMLPSLAKIESRLDPEHAVILGASELTGIIDNHDQFSRLELQNVTSCYFGVEDDDGNMVVVVPKGEVYPCEITKTFTTTEDNKKEILIHVLQAKDPENHALYRSIGHVTVEDIPPARAGEPNIRVTFSLDEYGKLKVIARHSENNKIASLSIKIGEKGERKLKPQRRGTGLRVV